MTEQLTLHCPIRGVLKTPAKSADGLRPSEEKLRIEAINYLVARGYPKEQIKVEAVIKKFGHGGRNSFRSDLAVLDVPVNSLGSATIDELLSHAVILGEVKRDNSGYEQVRSTQVEPMLDFASRDDCIALYWDDVEQRIFWRDWVEGKRERREGSLALLPKYGNKLAVEPLTFADIGPTDSLLGVFARIEDLLHAASIDHEQRYATILQLLLAKLYDEHRHESAPDEALDIQDFTALGVPSALALNRFNNSPYALT